MFFFAAVAIASYLLGSIPFGYLAGRIGAVVKLQHVHLLEVEHQGAAAAVDFHAIVILAAGGHPRCLGYRLAHQRQLARRTGGDRA